MRFLLVDRVEAWEADRSIRGWKNAAQSEDYFEWHFPERPIVPGMLVLEACAQLAGWLEAASSDFRSWFLLDRVHSARYYAFAVPGDRIDLLLERLDADDPARRAYRAESRVGDARGATLEFEGRVVPLEGLEAEERARRTWAQLRGETP
jgi:3-hydroxyacyl-[acyl-carrier-protein] dehydratase